MSTTTDIITGTTTDTDVTAERRATARIPLEEPKGLLGRFFRWYAERTFGDVPDPALAMIHHRPAMMAVMGYEKKLARWDRLDPDLKNLAVMASAATIGCSWCLDFGYYHAHSEGHDVSKLAQVPRWRDSDVFTGLERRVMEYAEAVTATPPTVTDELAASLREDLGNDGFMELTLMIAVENHRSRVNAALGLKSQGFSDRCELPS